MFIELPGVLTGRMERVGPCGSVWLPWTRIIKSSLKAVFFNGRQRLILAKPFHMPLMHNRDATMRT